MESMDRFKTVIQEYLENRAKSDARFFQKFQAENKSLDACITYILNQVKESGRCGFADDEIFGLAIHYYDEDQIEVGNDISANIIINKEIKLTPEEVAQAKKKALESVFEEARKRAMGKKQKVIKKEPEKVQNSQTLF